MYSHYCNKAFVSKLRFIFILVLLFSSSSCCFVWVMTISMGEKMQNQEIYESSFEDSIGSNASSSSSSDLVEDATSSSSSDGPLYELSELMAQLPIKRGLSRYYQGKSQTFTSLASVKGLEDLAKRGRPTKRKMKSCKSIGGGLNNHVICGPKATISKKKNSRICIISASKSTRGDKSSSAVVRSHNIFVISRRS